jgi:hypothetical protein
LANNPYVGSWSSGGSLNTARAAAAGSGVQTAALVAGGETATANVGVVESYNGTSFTEVNDLNTARKFLAAAGSSNTANLAFGGAPPTAARTETELWNWYFHSSFSFWWFSL